MTHLSCSHLKYLGWKKKGLTWEKGLDTITYDGARWMYFKFPECVKETEFGIKVEPIKINYVQEIKR